MISISMIVSDSGGNVIIGNTSQCKFETRTSRVSRSATLDGRSVIVHSGISDGDRTFLIKGILSEVQRAAIKYIYENSTTVLLSCSEGVFFGAFNDLDTSKKLVKASILIQNKDS